MRAAGNEPAVATLKTTVYRTSHDSALAPALIDAAEHGKQSVCIVELKARFDERRNIEWARSLEQAGVHVVYGFPDLKIHAKTTLVVRREGDRLRRYVHIGTGNYHATTARIYEDVGLFTADPDIAADIADLFNFITGWPAPGVRKILAAPFNLRRKLVEHIRAVARAAAVGEHARIRIKVNNLTDPAIIEELYRASQAGAEIDLIVRAICMLRPGVEGLSERIRVRSILGRFLEHSRLYCFEAGEKKTFLLGSADLMERNLDHRIEVIAPVESPLVRAEIEAIFRSLLADNSQSWELHADGTWERLHPQGTGEARDSGDRDAAPGSRSRSRPSPLRGPTCGGVIVERAHRVVDVGSNTVRLHVAHDGETVFSERTLLGLEGGRRALWAIPEEKLAEAATALPACRGRAQPRRRPPRGARHEPKTPGIERRQRVGQTSSAQRTCQFAC